MENINTGTLEANSLEYRVKNNDATIFSSIFVNRDLNFHGADNNGKITIKPDGSFLVNDKPIVKDIELYNEMCKIFNIKPQKVFNNG